MTDSQPGVRSRPESTQTIKRRGLLAAAAAFVAGLVAKLSEQPVLAGTDGDVVLGGANTTPGFTTISCSGANGTGLETTCAIGLNGWGLASRGSQFGIYGAIVPPLNVINTGGIVGAGVFGESTRANSAGVWGSNSAGGTGVRGDSTISNGLMGQSISGIPVLGQVPAASSANTIAMYGLNYSSYAGPGPGAGGFGVYGLSAKGHGLVGATASAGGAAVVGATNGVAGAFAGAFYGPVIVGGAFTVFGAKSAAVPHPDGSHRRLYCLESPESWFEDFGTGQLECGRTAVAIDPDFAALVDLTDYHVFLTDRSGDAVLSVVSQTPTGFVVEANRALAAGIAKPQTALNGAFSWRVVAKRKDIAGVRLEPVTIPPEPTLPPVPDIPTPTPPVSRTRR
jgi:hypothetical protein